jgi:succinate dehydrogenase/fumarate reductase cytochrome b subunit
MSSRETIKKSIAEIIRLTARILGILLLAYFGAVLLVLAFVTALRKLSSFREWVSQFNKRYLNPKTISFVV